MIPIVIASLFAPDASAAGLSQLDAPIGGSDTYLTGVSLSPLDGAAWVVGHDTMLGDTDPVIALWDGEWTELPTPNGPYPYDLLMDVVAVDTGAWVVGFSSGDSSAIVPIAAWWDGLQWVETVVPEVSFDAHLWYGLDAIAHDDAWAVGDAYDGAGGTDEGVAWHWDGATWTLFPLPQIGDARSLDDVAIIAHDDVWAVGQYYTSDKAKPLAVHWDGVAWTAVPVPGNVGLTSVSGSGPDDVWAVGYRTVVRDGVLRFLAATLHFDGTAWTAVRAAQPGADPAFLNSVVAVSPTEAWAVGRYMVTTPEGVLTSKSFAQRWDGTSWRVIASDSPDPINNELWAIDALGGSDMMAVGDMGSQFESQPLVLVP